MMKHIFYAIILFSTVSAFGQGLELHSTLLPDGSGADVYWFGWDLAAGNFNGDGFRDIAVSSPRADKPHPHPDSVLLTTGRVDIYYGPIPPGILYPSLFPPHLTLWGENAGDQFGISVANAGDFNGDGFEDILVGANVVENKGGAYVFFGGAVIDDIPDVVFIGENYVDNFGYSCTGIGDQNGDGYDDVLVGALYNDAIGPRTGRCYIYFGGDPPDSSADFIITGLDSLDDFGTVVDGPFDFDGDGDPDFVVGAVQAGGYWYKPGAGYVFSGGSHLDDIPDWTVTGAHPMEFFGGTVAALGDVDGDGNDDAVFGGYNHHEPPDSGVGRAVLLFGGTGDTITLIGDRPDQSFGGEVASAGDIDMDGLAEFAINQTYDPAGDSAGFVLIFGKDRFGDYIIVDSTCYNPTPSPGDWFATRMAGVGDVTGDGIPDFAIGDAKDTVHTGLVSGEGAVYIYSGWQELFPIEAEVIEPIFDGPAISACPRQGVTFRLRHPAVLTDLYAKLVVESGEWPWPEYTLDSIQLTMPDESTLVFIPTEDWDSSGYIFVYLVEAYRTSTGESIEDTVTVIWQEDMYPPFVEALTDTGLTDDPYPTIIWFIEDNPTYLDCSSIIVFTEGDTITPRLYGDLFWNPKAAVALSDFGLRMDYGDSVTICLDRVRDIVDSAFCGPNVAEPNCVTKRFYRQWLADLTFSSPGLSNTILTIGGQPGMTDGYDPGGDILMPPIPTSRVQARLSLIDEGYPHSLLRDLREADDDTVLWKILTDGSGTAKISWIPENLPTGVFLLNGKLDMHAYESWEFELGETLSVFFYTGPKEIIVDCFAQPLRWKLVSFPLYLETYAFDEIFDRYLYIYHYAFNTVANTYYSPERWPTGKGVWLFYNDMGFLFPQILSGWPIDTLWSPVYRGWNLIGAPIDTVPLAEISTEPPGALISGMLFDYNSSTGGYEYPTALEPGNGYWVLASDEAELWAPFASRSLSKSAGTNALFDIYGSCPPPPPSITGEEQTPEKPKKFDIEIYPNPFNSAVNITVGPSYASHANIEIFDINGRTVADIPVGAGSKPARGAGGSRTLPYEIVWRPAESLPSGIYLIKIGEKSKKAILIR
ncbi:hypothetical protein DRQ36_05405 [bacterium]|nr:MAG: hypothetical protein DRQ36_05405 [bacterium]